MNCPKCSSESWKNGKVNDKQRFKCKNCKYQFTKTTPKGKPISMKLLAIILYLGGNSMGFIARLLRVSRQTVLDWIRDFAKKNYEKPEPGSAIVLELDEMWHYLGKKNENYGSGKLLIELQADWLIGNWGIVAKLP